MSQEAEIYKVIARYLTIKHPKVIFRFDFAAGLYLSPYMANKHRSQNPIKGYPDLFIALPKGNFAGLFIEIKTDKANPFKKDGTLKANEHTERQAEVLKALNEVGYAALFSTGVDETIKVIESYLNQE